MSSSSRSLSIDGDARGEEEEDIHDDGGLARSLDDLIRRLSSSVFRNNTDRFLLLDGAFGRADLVTADHSAGQVWFRIKKCSPLEDHTFSLFLILRQPFIFGAVHASATCALSAIVSTSVVRLRMNYADVVFV